MQRNQSTVPVLVTAKVLVVVLACQLVVQLAETHAREHVVIHATMAARDHVMDVNVPF